MQHARANHQVERAAKLRGTLDRDLMQFEISQIVQFALKIARVAKLASLTSIAVIWASGCRSVYRAACEVPQPAIRISRPARGCLAGQIRWNSARRRSGFL